MQAPKPTTPAAPLLTIGDPVLHMGAGNPLLSFSVYSPSNINHGKGTASLDEAVKRITGGSFVGSSEKTALATHIDPNKAYERLYNVPASHLLAVYGLFADAKIPVEERKDFITPARSPESLGSPTASGLIPAPRTLEEFSNYLAKAFNNTLKKTIDTKREPMRLDTPNS